MFSGDQHSPDRPRLVDVVSLVLWGEKSRGVYAPRASLYTYSTHWLYGTAAPEVALSPVPWLRCDEVLWADSPVDSEGHRCASYGLWAEPSV